MMRLFFAFLFVFAGSFVQVVESAEKQENLCEKAVNQESGYRVSGIYGSSLELEQHPAVAYVLLREMQRFKVLQREFQQKTEEWRFEFVEMIGGKTIVFVYHRQLQTDFCAGPNAFFCAETITFLPNSIVNFPQKNVAFSAVFLQESGIFSKSIFGKYQLSD
jgi:hypothetical protein